MKFPIACALACALLSPAAAVAASPWDGAWRVVLSKSHYEGSTFTYTKKSDGMWSFSDGSAVSYDYGTDGKPYNTIGNDDTITMKMHDDHSWTYTSEHKGQVLSKTHEEVSGDGKTLTAHTKSYRPAGGTTETTSTYTRVSGTAGLAGTWKATKVSTNFADSYTIATGSDGTVTWTIPSQEAYVVSHMDGTPAPIHGPTYGDGFTLAETKANAHEVTYKFMLNGKILGEGKMVLAADGRSLVDTSWSPGKENEKSISFYAKQ